MDINIRRTSEILHESKNKINFFKLSKITLPSFIALIIAIVKHWEEIKVAMTGFYEKYVKPWLDPLIKGLEWVVDLFKKIADLFKKGMNKIAINVTGAEGINP